MLGGSHNFTIAWQADGSSMTGNDSYDSLGKVVWFTALKAMDLICQKQSMCLHTVNSDVIFVENNVNAIALQHWSMKSSRILNCFD